LEAIDNAEVLIGHQRLLEIFPNFKGEKRLLEDLSIMLEYLKTTSQRIRLVVLSRMRAMLPTESPGVSCLPILDSAPSRLPRSIPIADRYVIESSPWQPESAIIA